MKHLLVFDYAVDPANPVPEEASLFSGHIVPGRVESIDDLDIQTIRSTDEGVGFLVAVDGVTVFHAGDHACGREETKRLYREEIDRLKGQRIDIAFFPVIGCGIGAKEMIREGIEYAVRELKPALIAPMHAGDQYGEYIEFKQYADAKAWACEVKCPASRGFFFQYGKKVAGESEE